MNIQPDIKETIPDLKTVFPKLKKGVTLYRYPDKKYVVLYDLNKVFVNNLSMKILRLADGTRSLYEILQKIVGEHLVDTKEEQEQIYAFVKAAEQKGFLSLSSTRSAISTKQILQGDSHVYYPYHLTLELTYQCNLRCPQCYIDAGPMNGSGFLPVKLLFPRLEFLFKKGLRIIELTGGEPLLHPDFFTILDFCCVRFPAVVVLTNGTLMTSRDAERFGKYKDKVQVSISLDGPTAAVHDKIRGKAGAYEKTTKAIQLLAQQGVYVRVSMTVFPETQVYIEDTVELAKRLGAKSFTYSSPLPFGRAGDSRICGALEQTFSQQNQYQRIQENYKGFIEIVDEKKLQEILSCSSNCGAGWSKFVVSPTGVVRPCLLAPVSWFSFGNILYSSPEEIFCDRRCSFFDHLCMPKKDKQPCSSCQDRIYCGYCWVRGVQKNISEHRRCPWFERSGLCKYLHVDTVIK